MDYAMLKRIRAVKLECLKFGYSFSYIGLQTVNCINDMILIFLTSRKHIVNHVMQLRLVVMY